MVGMRHASMFGRRLTTDGSARTMARRIPHHEVRSYVMTNGTYDLDKVRKILSCSGANLSAYASGGILVENEPGKSVGRVQTLYSDMRKCGFKVRWLPNFGYETVVGQLGNTERPRAIMKFVAT